MLKTLANTLLTVATAAGLAAALLTPAMQAEVPAAAPIATATLTITFPTVRREQGEMMIAVYAADSWLRRPVKVANVPARNGASATITGLTPGQYGVAVYQDMDGDGEMDTGMFGAPTEPYGFSNNAAGMMGPASFADAALTVPAEGLSTTIRVR
jgi:uncharacterized protein (DUF2141 family)